MNLALFLLITFFGTWVVMILSDILSELKKRGTLL